MSILRRLLLICIAAFLTISPAYAQNTDGDIFPPQVIDVQPTPDAEIPEHDPLIVTFNQAMRRETVSLSFDPALAGQSEWLDHRTLAFIPQDEAWPRSRQYSVTVDGTAENGLTLDPYTFEMQTERGLSVAYVTPVDGTEYLAHSWSTISVGFDRPVAAIDSGTDRDTLPQPFTFSPDLPGSGRWVNDLLYEYIPLSDALGKATQYTVTVEAGLRAVDGTVLEMPYTWTFRRLTPQAISIEATRLYSDFISTEVVLLDSGFEVVYSAPLDKASAEAAFSLRLQKEVIFNEGPIYPDEGIPVKGTFSWNADGTRMTFQPSERLQYETFYRVVLEPTVQTEAGAAIMLTRDERLFETIMLPGVLWTTPEPMAAIKPGYQSVNFSFLSPMNMETLRGRYRVEPQPPGEITPYVHKNGAFSLKFDHELGQTYTVTLLPGIEDVYGTPMKEPYSFSYHVREKPLANGVGLVLNSEFVLMHEGQTNPTVPLSISGSPDVTLDLYRTDIDEILSINYTNWDNQRQWGQYYDSLYYYDERVVDSYWYRTERKERELPWVKPENRVFSTRHSYRGDDAPLHLSGDQSLPLGLYGVELHSADAFTHKYDIKHDKTGFVLAVTNAAITLRNTPDSWMAWVTDMDTGEPLPNQPVHLYKDRDTVLFSITDAEGIARWPLGALNSREYAYVVVEGEGLFGVWKGETPHDSRVTAITRLYTDRSIYRPGETVYFRGVLRDKDDVIYSVPAVRTLYATIPYNPYYGVDSLLYSEQLSVNDFGSFSGEIHLPADIPPFYRWIQISDCPPRDDQCIPAYSGYTNFYVADYRAPEYEIAVIPQHDEVVSGEPLNVMVETAYYFGEPVDNAEVNWHVSDSYGSANWRPRRVYARYNFFDDVPLSDVKTADQDGTGQTDSEGRYLIDLPFVQSESHPIWVRVRASIADESEQPIASQKSVMVHPANLYIGLRPQQARVKVGQPVAVDVVTITPQSVIRPDESIALSVYEMRQTQVEVEFGRYEWKREEILVTEARATTGADGKTVYRFTAPGAGQYRIRSRGSDEAGRLAGSSTSVIVVGADEEPQEQISRRFDEPIYYTGGQCEDPVLRRLRITANKEDYVPGDSAYIFIPNPFDIPVSAMISVERDGIQSLEVVRIAGDSAGLMYTLPITEAHAPNVYVSVTMMHGIGGEQTAPGYIEGYVWLKVAPIHRRLNIDVTASSSVVAPGDTVTFDLTVTDYLGNPVSAELGLSLVDEAVLALTSGYNATLEETYYNWWQPSGVTTSSAISALITMPLTQYGPGPCGRGGGGGGGIDFSASRGDYYTTPLWEPHVVTDEHGRASVSVVMPSNLTRWQFDAYAMTNDTKVGQGQTSITSTLPLAVRPTTPRFLVAGDRLPLSAIVHNNTDAPQTVDVTLSVEGVIVMQPESLTQTVEIAPRRRAVVAWPVVVDDVPHIDVTVSAEARSGLRDAAKPALGLIPVMRYTVRDTMATSGLLTEAGTITEGVSIPPRLGKATGALTVDLDASLLASIADGLKALWQSRAESDGLELVISRLYPELVLYNAQRRLGLAVEGQAQFATALDELLNRLEREQRPDGGWGWWSLKQPQSEPDITAYVLLGLSEVREAEYALNPDMLDDALDYLRGQIITPKIDTPPRELDRQAFFLYVLSRHDDPTEAKRDTLQLNALQLDALFEHRLEMSWAARAYLLMAYRLTAPESGAIPTLMSDLTSAAIFTATGAHWEETRGGYNWGSDIHTTAVVLAAIVQAQPENVLAPNTVRWLVASRRGDLWRTAQENAWALVALTEWMAYTGELDGDYTYSASVNGDTRLAVEVTPETVGEGETLTVPVTELLDREINHLDITRDEGDGALYYSALLDLHLPAEEVEAVSRGITVTRQYSIDPERDARTSAQVGDVVRVRLALYVSQNTHYFALEDTIPAGLEVINSTLLIERESNHNLSWFELTSPLLRYSYFNDAYFTRKTVRDEGVALYMDSLPRGGYVFSYLARAVTPGEFQAIPAQGYAVYQPEMFGHSEGLTFTVTPKER